MTLNYCSGIFFKSLSYLHKVVRTNFSADFWTFAIFDCNFAKCVAPPSNKKWELCSAPERAIHSEKNAENRIEIGLQTATQCLFELCTPQTNSAPASERDKKHTNTMFLHLQPAHVVRSSPNFARWQSSSRPSRCHPFFDPTNSFSYRVHRKIRPNWPTRGFSAITP